jgi:hypothetical protein
MTDFETHRSKLEVLITNAIEGWTEDVQEKDEQMKTPYVLDRQISIVVERVLERLTSGIDVDAIF